MRRKSPASILLVVLMLLLGGRAAAAEDPAAPKHLVLARTLLAELTPKDTSYRHSGWIKWKGDFLALRYEAHTDCSGLINGLLERAGSPSLKHLRSAAFRVPQAKDYYDLISREDGFRRIDSVAEVLPGDIVAVKYLPGHAPSSWDAGTGHVMLVDARPLPRKKDTRPLVDGTRQWEVTIIDSSKSPHGRDDTRQMEDGSRRDGVGRGIFRLYSDEQGKPVGYSWSIAGSSNFYDASARPLAIGRPRIEAVAALQRRE
jgi:hypothetical protein